MGYRLIALFHTPSKLNKAQTSVGLTMRYAIGAAETLVTASARLAEDAMYRDKHDGKHGCSAHMLQLLRAINFWPAKSPVAILR